MPSCYSYLGVTQFPATPAPSTGAGEKPFGQTAAGVAVFVLLSIGLVACIFGLAFLLYKQRRRAENSGLIMQQQGVNGAANMQFHEGNIGDIGTRSTSEPQNYADLADSLSLEAAAGGV